MSHTDVTTVVTEGSRVRIVYRDAQDEVTERVVDIDRVHRCTSKGRCLVVGYCWRRGEYRTFAMENILAAMPDESTTISTFAMMDAATERDTVAFHRAYVALHGEVA